MKSPALLFSRKLIVLLGLTAFTASMFARPTDGPATKTNATKSAGDKKPAAEKPGPVEIPKSVFVVPTKPSEGRDPFFPRSTYPYGQTPTPPVTKGTNPPPTVVELVFSGISGTPERPLAIINNQTFAVGESGPVVAAGRQYQVQLIEVNLQDRTATVEYNGQRKVLPLKK